MKTTMFTVTVSILWALCIPVMAADCTNENHSIMVTTPTTDFTIHRNGTVTHNNSGLMWMRCSLGQILEGDRCTNKAGMYTWQAAFVAAKGYHFAGYSDWRLPDKNELGTIVERRCWSPAINSTLFPDTPSLSAFWSSTPYFSNKDNAWVVDFGYGVIGEFNKDQRSHVRLVRTGQ